MTSPVLLNRIRILEDQVRILKTRQGEYSRSAKVLTISAGVITADYHNHFLLQPQSGTSDDLDTINGVSDGRRITLYPQDSGDTITVKNNTGNILLGADRILDSQSDTIELIYSDALGKWLELAFHDTSGGGADTEAAQDAVGTILLDSSTVDFTYDDATPSITAIVKLASITASHLQDGASLAEILDDDGPGSLLDSDLLDSQEGTYYLARANHTGTQLSTTISDFAEAAQDVVGSILVDSNTIDFTYDDAIPSITAIIKFNDSDLPTAVEETAFEGTSEYPSRRDHVHDLLDGLISNIKLDDMIAATVKGQPVGAATAPPVDLTAAQLVTIINTADGSGSLLDADTLDTLNSTAFFILAGQAGGQVGYGGTAANEDLILEGTSHATKTSSYIALQPNGGNVGIGTNAPAVLLHIVGSNSDSIAFLVQNTQSGAACTFYCGGSTAHGITAWQDATIMESSSDASAGLIMSAYSGVFKLQTGARSTRMTILSTGEVGIGDTAPLGMLSVIQASTVDALPVLELQQNDLSEEFINFVTTVGAGNPIDTAAVGVYYGRLRVQVEGVGYKYIPLYNA